ncbi:MAG: RluA family pseudouridine synthase [Rhodoferax sp.]
MKDKPEIISTPPSFLWTEAEWDDAGQEAEVLRCVADAQDHGVRLDRVLARHAAALSRSYVQQLMEEGAARCNGSPCTKAAYKVRVGDALELTVRPTAQSQAFVPQAMPLSVVYEDAHLMVLDKPAGLVVHPAAGHWSATLLNGLLAYDPVFQHLPRAGIVHRLDKDTSGLMVVAKQRQSMDGLVAAIAQRSVQRHYIALAGSAWKPQAGSHVHVSAAIGRDPRNRLRMAVVDLALHGGKPAATDLYCLDSTSTSALVHCKLHTGRTHQIRVHMAHMGMALLSDALYGGRSGTVIARQALHATRLALAHPATGQPLCFESPPAEDFAAELRAQGLRYNGLT